MAGISAMRSASTSRRTKLRPSALRPSPQIDSSSDSFAGASSFGLSSAPAMRLSPTTLLASFSICDHTGSAFWSRASENAASAYGRAMVVSSAMTSLSELALQLREQLLVHFAIHVALEDLRRAGDREIGHRVAQLLLRALHFLLDLGLGSDDDAVRF